MSSKDFFKSTTTLTYNLTNIGLYHAVYFIDNLNSNNNFIKDNQEEIINLFEGKNLTFKILSNSEIKETDFSLVLGFQFPILKNSYLYQKDTINLFDGTPNSAFLFVNGTNYLLTEIRELSFDFINNYISFFNGIEREQLFEPISVDDLEDSGITISEEAKKEIQLISAKIEALKETGQYLHILPIIENFIKSEKIKADDNSFLSPIVVQDDLKIILTNFNNLEVKLSTLTKCVYLLFLKNKQGIHLKELEQHKSELIGYYKQLSSRDNYDKMLLSIDRIIDLSSNEIYVHLSRIKSFFYKKFNKRIADNYIVNGAKNTKKLIALNANLITWEDKHNTLF